MKKKLTVLKDSKVFKGPNLNSEVIYELNTYDEPSYIRIKRRNGVTWYEIIVGNNSIGYLKEENAFQWRKVKIEDEKAYFYRRETKESEIEELIIETGSHVHIKHPHEHEYDNYLIVTSKGIIGEMPAHIKFRDPEWVSFKILFIISCVIVCIMYIGAMMADKRVVVGGLVVLAIALVSLVSAILMYLLLRIIKSIAHGIKIRL